METSVTPRSDFASRLYEKLAATHVGKNLFLSPFSIQVALAMCAVGARGETRRVLADLIRAPESVEEQNRQYARLLKAVKREGERSFQLVTANALWGQQGYHFNPDFKKAIADFYDGTFHEVNFRAQPDDGNRRANGTYPEGLNLSIHCCKSKQKRPLRQIATGVSVEARGMEKPRFVDDATTLTVILCVRVISQYLQKRAFFQNNFRTAHPASRRENRTSDPRKSGYASSGPRGPDEGNVVTCLPRRCKPRWRRHR